MTTEMNPVPKVYSQIVSASKAVGGVGRNGRHPRQGYSYHTAADVVEAVRNACAASGLVIASSANVEGYDGGVRAHVVVTVTSAEDGSSVEAEASCVHPWAGQPAPQASGSAITYAYKGILCRLFGIAERDVPEADDAPQGPATERPETVAGAPLERVPSSQQLQLIREAAERGASKAGALKAAGVPASLLATAGVRELVSAAYAAGSEGRT